MNQIEEKIKFSVVLPIYNVEKYLNRCLDSVMNQTYKKLEIILVDDGSPDSCPQMCDNWARVDDRIKVVHKKNAGLGEARNSGLDVATGDYIAFFDSDDYIDTRLFEELYTVIISDNPDLIEFGHHDVDRQGNITRTFIPKTPLEKYEGKEVLSQFLPELICTDPKTGTASDLLMSAWSCLYRRQLLVECNFHFVSEREYISEDVYSLMKTSVYKGYKRDKIEMRGDRAKISDFPLYLNTVAGGLDCRDQTIGGFSFVVKIYAVPVVEIIGQLLYLLGRYGFNAQFSDCL